VTGYGQEMTASIAKGEEIGAYACLYKPLEIDRLVDIIEEISLRKKQTLLEEQFKD
jgi:BarA-like signal transduction histidine kinase